LFFAVDPFHRNLYLIFITMNARYSVGLDYGTNSVRALIVDTSNGREIGTAVWNYEQGEQGSHPRP
jgi:sugar (pentulose or hexulose) kinase